MARRERIGLAEFHTQPDLDHGSTPASQNGCPADLDTLPRETAALLPDHG
jgi:hypothetical protein